MRHFVQNNNQFFNLYICVKIYFILILWMALLAPWENIFEKVSIDKFKIMGNKILKTLRVALLNPVTT